MPFSEKTDHLPDDNTDNGDHESHGSKYEPCADNSLSAYHEMLKLLANIYNCWDRI
jgi:hypothetical protein